MRYDTKGLATLFELCREHGVTRFREADLEFELRSALPTITMNGPSVEEDPEAAERAFEEDMYGATGLIPRDLRQQLAQGAA